MDDDRQGAVTVTEALDLLDEALKRIIVTGLRMDLRNCQFVRDKVQFLGYVIKAEGRTLDKTRVGAIDKFEPHRNEKTLFSFLQFANHYRKFVPQFSKFTHPLRQLLAKDAAFVWTGEHQQIVDAVQTA
ncbi:hypothetical protein V5799_005076 [Amblyomma americanum]|uniref:Reverse transcriptase/retrotransposon-derived protein RNase H-like domain-containing protein n=1 Tax=Amblyomma americanum TaxID=6943 RepID=A0AAQ4E0A5_AMBAM